MIFTETPLTGAYIVQPEARGDSRGFFARIFCKREFAERGLATDFVQVNNSLTEHKGTLRGMHYQLPPRAEVKLVRCIRGALYDAILDLREDSPTFGRHFGIELNAENRTMLYVPKGFAHGFVTLRDDTETFYLVDEFYTPDMERGIRWNDPKFGISWPIQPIHVSEKDSRHRDFDPAFHLARM